MNIYKWFGVGSMFMSLGMMLIGEWTAAAVFWFTLAFLMHYDVDYYNNNQR